MSKYAKDINIVLSQNIWTKADITHVMAQFRLIIEEDKLQAKYAYLSLYCDWILHTEISRSKTAYRMLESLTDCFINSYKDPDNSKWINDAVIEGFALHKLLENIMEIGQEFKIAASAKFTQLNNWTHFAFLVLDILVGKPLTFPNPLTSSAKLSYNCIILRAEKAGDIEKNAVVGFSFYKDNDSGRYHWEIKTIHSLKIGYRILGEIAFINQKMIDDLNEKLRNKHQIT